MGGYVLNSFIAVFFMLNWGMIVPYAGYEFYKWWKAKRSTKVKPESLERSFSFSREYTVSSPENKSAYGFVKSAHKSSK